MQPLARDSRRAPWCVASMNQCTLDRGPWAVGRVRVDQSLARRLSCDLRHAELFARQIFEVSGLALQPTLADET